MKRRLIPWTTPLLLVVACSGAETPSKDNGGAGTGAMAMAGASGTAGSSGGSAGKAGSGGSAGTSAGTAGTTFGAGGSAAGTAGSPGGAGPQGGSAGTTPTAGAPGGGAGAPAAGAGAGGAGSAGMAGAPAGGAGAGGAPAGGTAGMGGMGGAPSTAAYTCNQVIGIDSTSEWYKGGFEMQVPDGKWQIIYHHPGYVEDWADINDEVWGLAPTSACTMNSTNPDRVIFNIYSETLTDKTALVTAINKAVANFKTKYSRLQRIDILTMTRSPNNMPCVAGNNGSIVQQYVDDAVAMVVSAGPPPIIASPKFSATNCNVFESGGPHFSTTGMPIVAKIYGDYYSVEP